MRPRILKISGLNSYIEEQTIDFESLTEYGLFGIFGPTGSGKSTILDAMILALYGEIPRCDKKNLNGIINTNAKQVYVYYEFDIGTGNSRRGYSIERILKRTKDDGISTDTALLCDITNPEGKQILSDKVTITNQIIQEIIGLNAQDFMRSVVLPQGSFSEFLHLKGNERRQMLERIFCLEEYGEKLTEQVRKYQQKNVGELNAIDGRLKAYEDVSEEVLKGLENTRDNLSDLEKSVRQSLEKTEKDYEKYKNVWAVQEELNGTVKELESLREQQEDIEEKKIALGRARKAEAIKPFIDRLDRLEEDLRGKREVLANVEAEFYKQQDEIKKLETSWKQASDEKDRNLPLLAVRKENLTQAVEILNEAISLEQEVNSLRVEYNRKDKEIKKLKESIDENIQQVDSINKKVEENLKAQKKHIISSEERQAVEEAYSLERDYYALIQKYNSLESKRDTIYKQVEEKDKQLNELITAKVEADKLYRESIKQKEQHEKLCPGSRDILLEKQKELSLKQEQIRKVIEIESQIARGEEQLHQYSESEAALKKIVEELTKQYEDLENDYKKLNDELKERHNRNIAFILAETLEEGKACPVCGSIHHPMPIQGNVETDEIENLKNEIEKLQQELNSKRVNIARKEAEYKQVLERMQEMDKELVQVRKEIEDQNSSILNLECKKRDEEFKQLQKAIEQWEYDLKEIDNNLESDKNNLSEIGFEVATKKASLEVLRKTLGEMEDEIKKEGQNLNQVEMEYRAAQNKLGVTNFAEKIREIREHERELESLRKAEEKLKSYLDEINKGIESLQNEERKKEIEKVRLEESWQQKDMEAKNKRQQSQRLAGSGDPVDNLKKVLQEIESIQSRWDYLDRKYNEDKLQLEKLKNKLAAAAEGCSSLEEQVKKESQTLMGLLAEQGFADRDVVLEYFMEKKDMDRLDKEIQDYQKSISILEDQKSRLIKKLQGQSISKEDWEELQKQRIELRQKLEACTDDLRKAEIRLEDMNKSIQEKRILLMQRQKLVHKCGLIDQIADLLRGRRFVDFVARRQLQYIVRDASQRLKGITRQRYALEFDEEGNFIIRDDFNGGARRPAQSLSGGETFVASLSLALALSSHIQLGKSVLEFFFLDEGFGSLDAELLDTVINSLERLRNERLSVGLISHVEELKQRIPKKLLVYPAVPGQRGTRVVME